MDFSYVFSKIIGLIKRFVVVELVFSGLYDTGEDSSFYEKFVVELIVLSRLPLVFLNFINLA